jgi:hypothetical protein
MDWRAWAVTVGAALVIIGALIGVFG